MTDVIKTERLILRPVRMDDAPAMVAAVDDIEVSQWLTHVPHPYSMHDAEEFIGSVLGDFPSHAAIEYNGKFAGMISAQSELGYWLDKPHWGRGLVLEAAEALVARHFEDPSNMQIASGYILGNNRSRKILEILGFANTRVEKTTPLSTGVETNLQKLTLSRARWEAQR
jgi:RimJ/RimL family protein N-acetyltransferase